LDDEAKEKMLFDSEFEAKEVPSSNLQDRVTYESKKRKSSLA
jgi:hypothetical protein